MVLTQVVRIQCYLSYSSIENIGYKRGSFKERERMFYKWVKDDVVNKPSNHEGNLNKLIHARQTLSLSNIHYWRQETNHNVQNEIQLIFTVPT